MDGVFDALSFFASAGYAIVIIAVAVAVLIIWLSFWTIGPTEVGLVRKRLSFRKLHEGNPVAFGGEAGYQADLLMAGVRFKFWPIYTVTRHPMVQIPAGQIGVVVAQVGAALPIGAKSAIYKPEFANFQDIGLFVKNGGQKGVQRTVLSPGAVAPIHPVGFLVITKNRVYGVPVAEEYARLAHSKEGLGPHSFGLKAEQLDVVRIEPKKLDGADGKGRVADMIGIVTTLEGKPLPKGAIANRIGDFADIAELELQRGRQRQRPRRSDLVGEERSPQQLPGFPDLSRQGRPYRAPTRSTPVWRLHAQSIPGRVEMVPMLVVNQGQVAVVKAYVGLATDDTSGAGFKFGSLVRPGHRGIWQEPLRTGKYAINPRCYRRRSCRRSSSP